MDRSFVSRFQAWLNEWNELKTRQVLMAVLAVLMGLLAGMVVYTISVSIMNSFWSYPPGVYIGDAAQQEEQFNQSSLQIYLCTAASWAVGTLGGCYCATRVAKMGQFPAWITGILLTAYYWINLLFQPHGGLVEFMLCPVLVGICAYAGGWLGMYVTVRKQMKSDRREATPEDA